MPKKSKKTNCALCGYEIEDVDIIGVIKHNGAWYHGGCFLKVVD